MGIVEPHHTRLRLELLFPESVVVVKLAPEAFETSPNADVIRVRLTREGPGMRPGQLLPERLLRCLNLLLFLSLLLLLISVILHSASSAQKVSL